MKYVGSQRIETERLILRKVELDDAPIMFRNWQSDERVTKYLSWKPYPSVDYSYKVAENWISQYHNLDFFLWLIVEKETNTPIGTIGVGRHEDDWSSAEVGYCIGYDWWNNGYMTEALIAVIEYLLYKACIPEITCCCDRENKPSAHVMQKAGMSFKCTKRDYFVREDYICDILVFFIKRKSLFEKILNEWGQ